MPQAASQTFNNTLAAARTVSTQSIKVFAVVIMTTATNPVITFTNTAGTTVLKVLVPTNTTLVVETSSPWLTDGLVAGVESANTTLTVFFTPV